MNEKKRIEKIKNIKNFPMYYQDELGGHRIRYFVDELDLNWLIQQAEKAEQLQERVEELEMKYENTGAIFNRQYMREKIERYEKVLKEMIEAKDLADWLSQNEWATEADYFVTKAREALEGTE
ncbi:hypothetical protein SAMN05192569_10638 [Parageobacillus thermantarcticus]|uniref:Uncharacterized protein n=1 Tax=Parageobacillus thermantarcticus TaxID=186116 RepID=A0A1I0TUN3_9BACL|nr:hypothetical protein [Parageobacillus thermantarcticus]SFA55535.1 hypothetical protein SAMN05192569_10638 [Parageobacillus thermantarcticus]